MFPIPGVSSTITKILLSAFLFKHALNADPKGDLESPEQFADVQEARQGWALLPSDVQQFGKL